MKFSIDKKELQGALEIIKQVIPKKVIQPILQTIFIEASDGMLHLRASSIDTEASVLIPANISKEGTCCCDSVICELVSKFVDGRMDFNLAKTLTISQEVADVATKRKHRIAISEHDNFPNKIEIEKYTQSDAKMFDGFVKAAGSLSFEDSAMNVLGCFHIEPDFIITGNKFRASLYENINVNSSVVNVPGNILMTAISNLLSGSNKNVTEYCFGDRSAIRQTIYDNNDTMKFQWEIMINTVIDDFPIVIKGTIQELKDSKFKLKLICNKYKLGEVLEICELYHNIALGQGLASHVILENKNKNITLLMDIPETGSMIEPLECEIDGDDFSIAIDPKMLKKSLSFVSSNVVELRFFDSRKPLILLDGEDGDFTYLQMPMAMPL